MKIATWNVNSLRTRLNHVTAWLDANQPDVLCLQETKVDDALFPLEALAERGYFAAYHGQKSYNGVALLCRAKPSEVVFGFNGQIHNEQSRVIAGTVNGVRVISVYVPNGESLESPKFAFKREFFTHLTAYIREQVATHPKLIVCGDFNIAQDERDVDNPKKREKDVLFTPTEREWLKHFADEAGVTDAFRLVSGEGGVFSWWDYRSFARQQNRGMRIDYLFVSQALAASVQAVRHFDGERDLPQPSDHVPVLLELKE